MTHTTMTRAYALGLGYGSIWLVSACLASGVLDIFGIVTTLQETIFSLLGLFLVGGALLYLCIRFLRLGYTLPRSTAGKISAVGARIFGGLILLEVIGWGVLDTTLSSRGLAIWIVPVDLLIIGAHFIPLAFVFKVPAYLAMGLLWLLAIIGVIVAVPSTAIIGHESAWYTLPSICCVVITWFTVLFLMTSNMGRVRLVTQQG